MISVSYLHVNTHTHINVTERENLKKNNNVTNC